MGSIAPQRRKLDVKRVCIIGAGPSGLAAAKYLLAEQSFAHITIYDQRSQVGGLWNYSPASTNDRKATPIPQLSPQAIYHRPTSSNGSSEPRAAIVSPVYDRLEANTPRGLCRFTDLEWPEDTPLFPGHREILQYLQRYGEDVERYIHFERQVTSVMPISHHEWMVETRHVSQNAGDETLKELFDGIVVSTGHFDVPYVPSVPGMKEWTEAYPGAISHAMFYRKPEDFTGKKVIVVGNSFSGMDIGTQIATECASPLLQSLKAQKLEQPQTSLVRVEKPEISQFEVDDRTVRFADGSVERDVDAVVYCTGYYYSMPFLDTLDPPVITSGDYVEQTYQHIFYHPRPTLAFLALNLNVIPFPVAEAQSAVIARVWSGRLNLPSAQEMACWERATLDNADRPRNFHALKFPKDADYINMLHKWAVSADDGGGSQDQSDDEQSRRRSGRDLAVKGKIPPYWGAMQYWLRERVPEIKKAFQDRGEQRRLVCTPDDVGYQFT